MWHWIYIMGSSNNSSFSIMSICLLNWDEDPDMCLAFKRKFHPKIQFYRSAPSIWQEVINRNLQFASSLLIKGTAVANRILIKRSICYVGLLSVYVALSWGKLTSHLLWLGLTVILNSFCNDSIITGMASLPCTFGEKNAAKMQVFFELEKNGLCFS